MNRWGHTKRTIILSSAVALWLSAPLVVWADNATVTTDVVHVKGTWAEEEAKLNSQQVQIITKKEIEKKQAKSVEDIIFTQTNIYKVKSSSKDLPFEYEIVTSKNNLSNSSSSKEVISRE